VRSEHKRRRSLVLAQEKEFVGALARSSRSRAGEIIRTWDSTKEGGRWCYLYLPLASFALASLARCFARALLRANSLSLARTRVRREAESRPLSTGARSTTSTPPS
jgi:hypothetical protein